MFGLQLRRDKRIRRLPKFVVPFPRSLRNRVAERGLNKIGNLAKLRRPNASLPILSVMTRRRTDLENDSTPRMELFMSLRWLPRLDQFQDVQIITLCGVCIATLVGCQSMTPHAVVDHTSSVKLVSEQVFDLKVPAANSPFRTTQSTKTRNTEPWQLQKSQREDLAKERAKAEPEQSFVSLSKSLWQSEEPAPCYSCEHNSCDSCPPAGTRFEFSEADEHCDGICFGCDCSHGLPALWQDAKGVVRKNNLLILAVAGGAAIALREGDGDRETREWVNEHPERWGELSDFLGDMGRFEVQVPVMLGFYGYSVWSQNEEMHEVMGSVLSAATITGLSTTALKFITNTSRPSTKWNDGEYGFPSYHAASTFAVAAVLDEYYGAKVGLPAYALAGAIGFSRIDQQDHNLSDVVFGSALGFVVGKAVAGRHLCGSSEIRFTPYIHPTDGSSGVACEWQF